jgi:multicomponent Na+:H+ antiporter subunit D
MKYQLPILLFLVPFVTAVAMPVLTARRRSWCRPLTLGAISVMIVLAVINLRVVLSEGAIEYPLGGWAAPLGIAWLNDALAAIIAVTMSSVALLSVVYGRVVVTPKLENSMPFYTLVLLFVSSLIGIIFAADLFNIFVFLEVAALTGYALVAADGGKALVYAFRYLLLGSFGAILYLLGVSYLYGATGTLNMADLATRLPDLITSTAVVGGLIFVFLGLSIKMALVPLHGWLPGAYANAPSAVAPLLASTVTKVALVAWVRIEYALIAPELEVSHVPVLVLLEDIGVLAAIVGGALALVQTDVKRMFAYGGISHIGLMLVGVSLGNSTALAGGLFYLINDAVMQAALFMIAGAALHYHGAQSLDDLKNVSQRSAWLTGALVVVAISMVGLPPTGGFFGKWNIVLGALEAEHYLAVFAVLASTLLTLGYFLRLFSCWFHQPVTMQSESLKVALSLRVSLGIASVAMIVLGLASDSIVQVFLESLSGGGI